MTRAKEPWDRKVGGAIDKLYRVIRSLGELVYKILHQAMDTVIFLVTLVVKLIVNPTATIAACVAFLTVITLITAFQWWQIGFWAGRLIGMPTLLGWGLGTVGMAAGLFLNIEELSPELHKISENLARAFDKMGVRPDHDVEPDNIKDRLANWYSYDMNLGKKGRLLSYGVETAVVIVYIFGTGLTLQAIAVAVVSLTCPELAIKYLSSKTSLYGTATAIMSQNQEESAAKNFGGGGSAKGGKGGGIPFDMPGEVPQGGGKRDRF